MPPGRGTRQNFIASLIALGIGLGTLSLPDRLCCSVLPRSAVSERWARGRAHHGILLRHPPRQLPRHLRSLHVRLRRARLLPLAAWAETGRDNGGAEPAVTDVGGGA